MRSMHRISLNRLLIICLALLVSTIPVSSSAGNECNIKLKVKNNENQPIKIFWDTARVKVKGKPWKGFAKGIKALPPRQTDVKNLKIANGCKIKRRYKITMMSGLNRWTEFYPNPRGWTTNKTVIIRAKK